ncbi:MAG: flagellar hook-basal body complex protein, partial [Hydrogenophaga sp.]|nr:flagellar hook-basal body complex protein [Hydrogenophaga sp.]
PLTAGITLPAESQSITVSSDGVVTAKLPGNPVPQQVGNIELANFINSAGLEPLGQNLFAESLASGNPITGAPGSAGLGTVMQGMVETSNVNVVQELVTMIQTQRAYEMNSKAIQTSDQMLQRLSQL